MDKQQLIQKIEQIPKFVLRDAAVREDERVESDDGVKENLDYGWAEAENWKAVTEEGSTIPLAFVSKSYSLVQFDEVFKKLIDGIPYLDGQCIYYNGVGLMDVFPNDEKLKVNGGDRIGMVALNSVNRTTSVIIKFCVSHGDKIITVPKKIAGFKRMHMGKAMQITQNFLVVVDKVREIWKTILTEFEKIKANETYVTAMMDEVEIKDNYLRKKVIKKVLSTYDMNLWDTFLYMLSVIEERSFKSDVHRRKKLDLISEKMFKYAVVSRLINA